MNEPRLLPTDKETIQQRLRHFLPDRVWVGPDAIGGLVLYRQLPPTWQALEYMRVLTRQEVEKLANDKEGVDAAQWINSLLRTVEGQRKHIATLQERIELLTRENGAMADAYLNKMGIDPSKVAS